MTSDLKALVAARLDIETVLDILGWDYSDLIEALDEHLNPYTGELQEAVV